MVKIMQIDSKTVEVMTSVTLTFDLERWKSIQKFIKVMILLYKARSIYDNKPVIFYPDMVKFMQIDPKTDKVMTSVTLTFDLER